MYTLKTFGKFFSIGAMEDLKVKGLIIAALIDSDKWDKTANKKAT